MNKKKKIRMIITISSDGEIKSEVENAKGKECISFAEPLYELLGEENPEDRKYKPEYRSNFSVNQLQVINERKHFDRQ